MRGQHRADQRTRPGDGRKVVSEDHPFVGRQKIPAIFQALCWRGALRVQRKNFRRDELAIEAISKGVRADGGSY